MRPELSALGSTRHDLLVIGGGILGACLAWDAALRGLKVALVERGELGGATSAQSLWIIYGGLRYLVRGDLRGMRESIRERSVLLRIAPRLVGPLPVAISSGIPAIPAAPVFASAWPSTTSFPPAAIATSFQIGICPLDGCRPQASWLPSVQALAPWPDAGEPCGLTVSCLAPNNSSGLLCARPQNMAVR